MSYENYAKKMLRAAAVCGATLGLTVGQVAAYEAGAVSGGGTIKGAVTFKGAAPAPAKLEVNKDKEVCAVGEKFAQDLVVGDGGGIKYAVVSLTNISKGKPFAGEAAVLDQAGCEYLPHVVLAPAGEQMDIKNSDGILHNIHTYSEKNKAMNRAQPKFKKVLKETFSEPETIRVTCDVHGWMQGWVVVQDHPYYVVTDASGAFELGDVPPGDYEIKVWQEKLGESTQNVTVAGGGVATVNFELSE
jgi:plastocyanin